MKPGYKTTEFWLSSIAMLVLMLGASGVFGASSTVGQIVAFAGQALAALGYTWTRGAVKKAEAGVAKPPAEQPGLGGGALE